MNALVLVLTFAVTAMALLVLQPVAARVGLLDIPGGRKSHSHPTPLIGGLGIYLGVLCISLLTPIVMEQFQALLMISAFVLLVGILDDMRELRVSLRMACHAAAAWMMISLAGVQLHSLGNLVFTGPVELGVLAVPLTIFATFGVINAINMSDGLDGLSGGLVVIALLSLSIAATTAGQTAMLSFNQILIVSLMAFLLLNFRVMWKKSAMVYLGDAGSTLLGFIIAWLVIAATQGEMAFIAPVYALWFLAVPLMDTVALLIRRPLRGRSPFSPGQDHLHHQLLRAGLSKEQTVLVLYSAAILMAATGLAGHLAGASESIMFLLFLAVFAVYFHFSRIQC